MSLIIDPLRVPCTNEGCQKHIISTLYFINGGTDQKCKECAKQALSYLLDILKDVFENDYKINADRLSDDTLNKLLETRIKIIEVDEASVTTKIVKLVVKDPADPYRNQILTTAFLRSNHFEN